MAGKLPLIGVTTIVAGLAVFEKQMQRYNKALAKSAKNTQDTAKQSSGLSKVFSRLSGKFPKLSAGVGKLASVGKLAAGALRVLSTVMIGVAAAIGIAVVAVAGLGAAFLALGRRGATLTGLMQGFNATTRSVGILADALLGDLQRASAGTIRDFELMRLTNVALAGATGEFGREFGTKLPALMEIARVQARATGESVEFLFSSLVRGIKRSSPLLIDNTGLVVNLGDANQQYAESIGKTVEQLTDQEKQIALLNGVIEAGAPGVAALGEAQETAAEKLARSGAIIANTMDTLALSIQPAFGAVLDVFNSVLAGIAALVTQAAPFIGALSQMFANFLAPIAKNIGAFFETLTSGNTVANFFTGGARMIGALAGGIARAANEKVFPLIIGIATFIADFLSGLSPPKKGPLSTIDQGGANLIAAWTKGMAGASLDAAKNVAANVQAVLGDIAGASLKQVERQLRQLDIALTPFNNQLAIAKANLEAIKAPADAALRAIDRQIEGLTQALLRGDEGAAEQLRTLQAQRDEIRAGVEAQQAATDQAEIQLALAKASQAQERALLNIRKAQIGVVSKIVKAAQPAVGGGAGVKEPKLGGGAGTPELPEVGGVAGPDALLPGAGDVSSLFGVDPKQVQQAGFELSAAFDDGLGKGDPLGAFQKNTSELQTQVARIGKADIGAGISKGISGLGDSLVNSFRDTFSRVSEEIGAIVAKVQGLVDALPPIAAGAGPGITAAFGNMLTGATAAVTTALESLTVDISTIDDALANITLDSQPIQDSIQVAFDNVQGSQFDFSSIGTFIEDNLETLIFGAVAAVALLVSGPVGIGLSLAKLVASAIQTDFLGFGTFLKESGISDLVITAFEDLKITIGNLLTGIFGGADGLSSVLEGGLDLSSLTDFANSITEFLQPVIDAIQSVIDTDIVPGLADLGTGLSAFFAELSTADVSGFVSAIESIIDIAGPIMTDAFVIIRDSMVTLIKVSGAIIGGTLSTIGSVLGPAGEALSSFITTISNVLKGDFSGAVTALADGIGSIQTAFLNFAVGSGDTLIEAINALTGFDLPTITEALDGIGGAVESVFDGVKRFLDKKIPEIKDSLVGLFDGLPAAFVNAVESLKLFIPVKWAEFVAVLEERFIEFLPFLLAQVGIIKQSLIDFGQGLIEEFGIKIQGVADIFAFFFTSEEPGSLTGIINSALAWFATVPQMIADALSSTGALVWTSVAQPIIGILNSVIDAINSAISFIGRGVASLIGVAADALGTLSGAGIVSEDVYLAMRQLSNSLLDISNRPIPRINIPMPEFGAGAPTPAAQGGVFGPGGLKVGERGTELVSSAQKMAVFPNEFITAVDRLTNVMSQVVSGGTTNVDNSVTANFSGGMDADGVMLRLNSMRAFKS